jgi:hypothetical protein
VVPLIGYLDRFSARPGERIAVKVSSQLDRPYRADLVRIIHADANPAGPGIKLEDVPAAFTGTYPSRFQPVHLGSCGVVTPPIPSPCPIPARSSFASNPGCSTGDRRPFWRSRVGRPFLSAEGARLEMGDSRVQVATPMLKGRWYELRVIATDGRTRLRQTALQRSWGIADSGEAEGRGTFGALAKLTFGAASTARPKTDENPYCAFFPWFGRSWRAWSADQFLVPPLQHAGSASAAAAFDPTGERVVTASDDKSARILGCAHRRADRQAAAARRPCLFCGVRPQGRARRSGGLPGRRLSPQQTSDFHRTMAKVCKSGG